jgi:hexokinase
MLLLCVHTGLMLIEKLMSGLYMGDCARRILLSFARDAHLFGGVVPELLTQKGSFTTAGESSLAAVLGL